MMSMSVFASRPAFTPIATAFRRQDDRCRRQQIVGQLGNLREPQASHSIERLAERLETGSTSGNVALPHDTMTASVPFVAPPTPPLTGNQPTPRRVPADSATCSATVGPVVDRSMSVFRRLPFSTLRSPRLTDCTIGGVGRLMNTMSADEATSSADEATLGPPRRQRLHRFRIGIEHAQRMAGIEQPIRHRPAHTPYTHKSQHLIQTHLPSLCLTGGDPEPVEGKL